MYCRFGLELMVWHGDQRYVRAPLIRTRWQSFAAAVFFLVLAAVASWSVWTLAAGMVVVGAAFVMMWARAGGPVRCHNCGYNLSGSPGTEAGGAWGVYVCPECGLPTGRYAPPTKPP
jgi:hypothetical protein